ncbi:MAG: hypothetical protein KatS3mg052_2091 [Candidatus Roseilinea sp.]|nr:MAG: hypothetical protein KatS3mg052_2091 [Candidatus Roseilinea sp.]
MSDFRHQHVIRASDIGQYAYCARAWWLISVVGAPSANAAELQRGAAMHRRHGRAMWLSGVLVIVAAALAGLALLILIAGIIAR